MTLFEIEVKNLIFIVKQFLDNERSITLETLKNNKIWICRKHSHPCTIIFMFRKDYTTVTEREIAVNQFLEDSFIKVGTDTTYSDEVRAFVDSILEVG